MPSLDQARQLSEFAEEIFEITKNIWASQSNSPQATEISETEFLALDALSKQAPLTVGDIQRQIGVLPAQMSRIVRSLESKGDEPLIQCTINPQDKRKIDVQLTPAGQKAHNTYRQIKLGSTEQLLLGLSDEDRQEFMRIIRLLRQEGRNDSSDS